MQPTAPRRFWLVLITAALGLAAVLVGWLESGALSPAVPDVEAPSPPPAAPRFEAERTFTPVAAVTEALARPLTAEQARRVADWIRRLEAAADPAARDEVLEDARSHEDTEVLVELVLHLMNRVGPEERINALQKLVGNSGLAQIKAFVRGLEDSNAEVREASLQLVRDQEPEVRIPVFEHGLGSADAAIRSGGFLELTRENVKAAIPGLMRALDLSDPGLREQALNELQMRLSDTRTEPFRDAAEAQSWWQVNGSRYDERMNRVD